MRSWLTISLLSLTFFSKPVLADEPKTRALACLDSENEAGKTQSLLSGLLRFPTIPYMIADKDGVSAFVPTSSVFASVLGTANQAVLINHAQELRFLPNVLAKSALLLVLNQADGFSDELAAKAIADASDLELTISLVWISNEPIPAGLTKIVKATSGLLVEREELVRRVFAYACPTKGGESFAQDPLAAASREP